MGSQSVTDFTAARKKQIQSSVRAFDPASPEAGTLAAEAGAAAMKSLAPSSEFAQALTSKSVEVAANTISDLVTALRSEETRGGDLLGPYGVDPSDPRPYAPLVAGLRLKFSEELNASSRKTEAAEAASDALGATVLDVITGAFPRRKEPSEVTRQELLRAIRGTPDPVFSQVFVKNLLTSLLRQTFDAARGKIAPEQIDALMKAVEPRITALAARLTRVGKK